MEHNEEWLPNDVARCGGLDKSMPEYAELCESCKRITAPRDGLFVLVRPPDIIAGVCRLRMPVGGWK